MIRPMSKRCRPRLSCLNESQLLQLSILPCRTEVSVEGCQHRFLHMLSIRFIQTLQRVQVTLVVVQSLSPSLSVYFVLRYLMLLYVRLASSKLQCP